MKKKSGWLAVFFILMSCSTSNNSVIQETAPYISEPASRIIEQPPAEAHEEIHEETTSIQQVKEEPVMVYYEGQLLNIFFHPLIARPQTAFNSSHRAHFLEWYVTAGEYRKILYELYINDYVLVDIKELYEVGYSGGRKTVTYKKPLIPAGKKPLVLSVDDLNYYDFVRENASVDKLIIDADGNIAALTGNEISYDLDIVTYTEVFIKENPDFSIRGAKGIIALTGYEGVLGYHTHKGYEGVMGNPTRYLSSPEYLEEKANATAVANRLKELGWHFASHSWGHPNLPNISMAWFTNDKNRWEREVRPILGETDLYIYPFGAGVEHIEERHRLLRELNFNVFFGVGAGLGCREGQGYIYMDRRNIDGVYFRLFRNRADRLFDIDKVIDAQARR